MNPRSVSATTAAGAASPAVRFHTNLADRTESEAVDRYLRHRRLLDDVSHAARWADAMMRLEMALRTASSYYP